MSEQPAEALRRALNEIDRLRKRSVMVSRFLVYTWIAFLVAAYPIFLFRGAVWLGMPFALVSLSALIAGVGINVAGASYANTQRILRAIEMLSQEKPKE
jgi:hypothetical protein